MSEAIIVALITAAAAVVSQLLIARQSSRDIYAKLDKHQAVTDTKLDALTAEVREHNNFAKRMPVLEEKVANLEKRLPNA